MTDVTPTLAERVSYAAARLVTQTTHLQVTDYGPECLGGNPGVVAENLAEIRFCAVRFRDVRGTDGCEPMAEVEDPHAVVADAERYIVQNHVRVGGRHVGYDRIDIMIVSDDNATARRIVDVVENATEPDAEFESRFTADAVARVKAGEDVPVGTVNNVDGEIEYTGAFEN